MIPEDSPINVCVKIENVSQSSCSDVPQDAG
jgi:hypothetical protein